MILATPAAEGEENTASIEEAVVRSVLIERVDARIALGGKGNNVTPAAGFNSLAVGAATPASAATRTASGGASGATTGAARGR